MLLRWFGQACFELSNKISVVTDPHDGRSVGLKAPECSADLVLISHEHFDHASGKNLVAKENALIVSELGSQEVKGIRLEGIGSWHDKAGGAIRGENTIFRFKLGGFSICHLGDLGHKLSDEKASRIKPLDILLVPVGGNYTINGKEAWQITKQLKPKIVVPMHYKIPGLLGDISSADEFLDQAKWKIEEKTEAKLDKLPAKPKIIKLECQA